MRGTNGKEPGFDVMREQRLALILNMHVSGASSRAISDHLKRLVEKGQANQLTGEVWRAPEQWAIGHVQVTNEIKEALAASRKENKQKAADLAAVRELRLKSLMLGVWPKAATGDVGAVWAALAIDDRLAALTGTTGKAGGDKPVRVVFSVEDNGDAPSTNQATGPAPESADD